MKTKKLKVKWKNVIKLLLFIFCVSIILHDIYMLTVHSWITGNLYGWTWVGLLTFFICLITAGMIYEDLEEQTKSVSNTGTVRHTYK